MTIKSLNGQQNQCPSCGLFFGRNSTFDKHRIGKYGVDRRCMTIDQMQSAGFYQRSNGFWAFSKPGSIPYTGWDKSSKKSIQSGNAGIMEGNV